MKNNLKNIVALIILVISFYSCTDNVRARKFGGSETINLDKGKKLLNVTFERTDLWYLVTDADSSYVPKVYDLKEKSSFGVLNGTVKFVESK